MIFMKKTTQAVIGLSVLMIISILILPPGMNLELCFGKNGHVDFSLENCGDSVSPNIFVREWASIYGTAHHGECLDVAVACSATPKRIHTYGKRAGYKSKLTKNSSKTLLPPPKWFSDSVDTYLGSNVDSLYIEDFSYLHFVSLRTIVLLI